MAHSRYSFVSESIHLVQLEKQQILSLIHIDAADERSSVDLGGRRIIKKKKKRGRHTGNSATQN